MVGVATFARAATVAAANAVGTTVNPNLAHLPAQAVTVATAPLTTIKSVELVDAKFKTQDTLAYEKYWSQTWLNNSVSQNIYEAIASKAGSAGLQATDNEANI